MGSVQVDLPPPSYWQDFERITLDVCRKLWNNQYAEPNGRQGQAQGGVDVYGYDNVQGEYVGVQCKKRKNKANGLEVPSTTLTVDEIDAEIKEMKASRSDLDRYVIATTGPRDVALQDYVREYNRNNGRPEVTLWFWDGYVSDLNDNPNLLYRYYEGYLKASSRYSTDEHYYRMLAMGFDRPAMVIEFRDESEVSSFVAAIKLLQTSVTTGKLLDHDGHFVDQAHVPRKSEPEIKSIKTKLRKIISIAQNLLEQGVITQSSYMIIIRDPAAVQVLNDLRRETIGELNAILRRFCIEEVFSEIGKSS
jgi:hypothetical protein